MINFRRGAFISGHPIQPMVIQYHYNNFSPTWESVPFLYHFLRLSTQLYNSVSIEILDVYYPSKKEKQNIQLYMENVRKKMCDSLNLSPTNSSIIEKLEFHHKIISKEFSWQHYGKLYRNGKKKEK